MQSQRKAVSLCQVGAQGRKNNQLVYLLRLLQSFPAWWSPASFFRCPAIEVLLHSLPSEKAKQEQLQPNVQRSYPESAWIVESRDKIVSPIYQVFNNKIISLRVIRNVEIRISKNLSGLPVEAADSFIVVSKKCQVIVGAADGSTGYSRMGGGVRGRENYSSSATDRNH